MLALCAILMPSAWAEDRDDGRETAVVLDVLVARPLGLLSIAAGSALFIVSLPFTIPSGSMDAAATELVKKPVHYTFKRPLGELGP
jgi:hypothetical protein